MRFSLSKALVLNSKRCDCWNTIDCRVGEKLVDCSATRDFLVKKEENKTKESFDVQVLNEMALRLAVDTMLLIPHPNHHILFNSLLGQASVNHLHLHSCSWPYDSDLINRVDNRMFITNRIRIG